MRHGIVWMVAIAACCSTLAYAEDKVLTDSELAAMGTASTALVECQDESGFGSTFCVAKGLFLTNFHVIQHTAETVDIILNPGEADQKKVRAKILRRDEDLDLALLGVDEKESPAPIELGSDADPAPVQEVLVFGFPFGKQLAMDFTEYPSVSVNKGRITALRKRNGTLARIQTDAAVNPGNSGGPMLDKYGKLVGVVVSGFFPASVNFAIPASHVRQFLSRPLISIIPPAISRTNWRKAAEFQARTLLFPPSPKPPDLELVLHDLAGIERKFAMQLADGVYTATAVPSAVSDSRPVKLSITFPDGEISGTTPNRDVRVGENLIRLSDLISFKPGQTTDVQVAYGAALNGEIKLDSIVVKVGPHSVNVDLSTVNEVKINQQDRDLGLICTVFARQNNQEIGRDDILVSFDESVDPASNVFDKSLAMNNATGTTTVAATGTKASLDFLADGIFTKPPAGSIKATSLKVVSAAGEYAGQGKRLSFAKGDLVVKASDGQIEIQADRCHLWLSPGKGQSLKAGEYIAKQYAPTNTQPGIEFSGDGRACKSTSGKFVVWEFVMNGAEVESLAIDFIQNCDETGPPSCGMLRYNSTLVGD